MSQPPFAQTDTPAALAASLWDFSLAVYDVKGVDGACISLQDRFGLDVAMLLLCCWIGAHGKWCVADIDLPALDGAARAWQDTVIGRLRAARRGLKGVGGPGTDIEAFAERARADILAIELAGERALQRALIEVLPAPLSTANVGPNFDAALAARLLGDYVALRAVALDTSGRGHLFWLLGAAFPGRKIAGLVS